MPKDTYPKFRAVAVQAASVFLDRDATIEKMEDLVKNAASNGADLVVFPESFVPAFPVWNIVYAPIDQHDFYRKLFDNAITVGSDAFKKIAQIAKSNKVFLSVGITEKDNISMGAMWNTNLLFDRDGKLLNRHRKLVPTWAEKLTWANGDASQLHPVDTEIGKIGALICGENTNTLSRFSLLAQGEQVHISCYPPVWPFQRPEEGKSYNLTNAITLRAAAHAFEGKVFNIVSSGVLDEDAIQQLSQGDQKIESTLRNAPQPVSLIVGPTGDVIGEPLVGKEGMVEAEIDISQSIILKQAHDIVGYYNRFDIYQLKVNKRSHAPITIEKDELTDQLINSTNKDLENFPTSQDLQKV
ncbi:carbon-nitrogen hydrolase family protein [Peribacillus glennii]|uniref:Carbon-nitrogen hydrolase family protein n=1 Tax=Peribacillus glennii TaxID=2303991 RepID=A0A372LFE1_9BACI|nr:carbon-nitrogen hydrolase family protein [Peribacillus glennii]RFU64967.1 carbon-nitrogen hydrolase family protein [Peribacillus glennii]